MQIISIDGNLQNPKNGSKLHFRDFTNPPNVGNNCKKQPKFNNLMQQNINEKD